MVPRDFSLLEHFGIANKAPKRSNLVLAYKLKILTLLMRANHIRSMAGSSN